MPQVNQQQKIAERRERVQAFYTAGLRPSDIAKQLDVTERTIWMDIAAVEKKNGGIRLRKTKEALVGLLAMRQDARIRRLWSIASEASPAVRVSALEKLGSEDDRFLKQAQTVGLLPKDIFAGASLIDNRGGLVALHGEEVNIYAEVLAVKEAEKRALEFLEAQKHGGEEIGQIRAVSGSQEGHVGDGGAAAGRQETADAAVKKGEEGKDGK